MKKRIALLLAFVLTLSMPLMLTGCDTEDELTITYVEIVVKDFGSIVVCLDPTYAPLTVANFLKLVDEGFYDGLTFHRIIHGFMIQGGDPDGDGSGGSSEAIKGEFAANGVINTLRHKRGVISMARGTDMNSASSQFFICHEKSEHLDGKYASFGYVVEGMEIVDAIANYGLLNPDYYELNIYGEQGDTMLPEYQPVIECIRRTEFRTEEQTN